MVKMRKYTVVTPRLFPTVGAVCDRAYFVDSGKNARSFIGAARCRACASQTAPTGLTAFPQRDRFRAAPGKPAVRIVPVGYPEKVRGIAARPVAFRLQTVSQNSA